MKFSSGYNFTEGRISHFLSIFAWANALPMILCRGVLLFSLARSLWCFFYKIFF